MKKDVKKIVCLVLTLVLVAGLTACGGANTAQAPEEKVYVSEDEVDAVFSNPEDYEGKYIQITGQVFNVISETSSGTTQYQADYDLENYEEEFMFEVPKDGPKFSENDYIRVDGKITGAISGENYFGVGISMLSIAADTATEITYMEAAVPTLKTIEPGLSQEQNGARVTIDKVEFAEKETRVYVTEINNGNDNFHLWVYEAKVIQGGEQIDLSTLSSSYMGDYPELTTDLLPGASSSGIIVFDPVNSSQPFTVNIPCGSDNYEIEMTPFIFEIPAE